MVSSLGFPAVRRGSPRRRTLRRIVLATLVPVVVASSAAAQDSGFAKEGFFVGVTATGNAALKGPDFDGAHFFRDSEELLLVPSLNEERSYGLVLGGRFPRGAIEFVYARSRHPASFGRARGTADLHLFDINFRGFLLTGKRVQPWWLAALTLPALVVRDASSSRREVGDARYGGVGASVGGGLSIYLHPRLAVQGGYVCRWLMFGDARGVAGHWKELDEVLHAQSLSLHAGVTVTF